MFDNYLSLLLSVDNCVNKMYYRVHVIDKLIISFSTSVQPIFSEHSDIFAYIVDIFVNVTSSYWLECIIIGTCNYRFNKIIITICVLEINLFTLVLLIHLYFIAETNTVLSNHCH